ncbi:calcium-binding protein [Pseudomonas sp. QTF5]|uniref:calcium-binding protein n=1 Tax=Pseudomonas sp. QTF5 TaxID=1435425 RepID=UPI00117B3001|nr:calcium-binding protein [Pseudomonas sp. QTF5]
MATVNGNDNANILTGSASNDTLNGLGGNDTLYGNGGDDTLDGGTGNDLLVGGRGSDTYRFGLGYGFDVIDNSGGVNNDVDTLLLTNLNANQIRLTRIGNDLVLSVVASGETLTVSQNFLDADHAIDRIQFADGSRWSASVMLANLYYPPVVPTDGADVINGNPTDDSLLGLGGDDTLYGNGGNDTLDGGSDNDRMEGGVGNDTYVVDAAGDVVVEANNAGDDLVQASINYTLGNNVERLTLTGSANINGVGNSLANTLIGNTGNNLLDGGAGADSMAGGSGDDTYIVDKSGDSVSELAGGGNDTVRASLNYSLGANLENLELTGSSNLNGTGNALANQLTGNTGNNLLDGGAGDDFLAGRRGNDTYLYGTNYGNDVIDNSGGASADVDTVQLMGLNSNNVSFVHTGNDLQMVVLATSQTLTLKNFYLGADYEIDRVQFANGTLWNKTTLLANVQVAATNGPDMLFGGNGDDVIQALAGNDQIYAQAGNDTLDGGVGDDVMYGSTGDDLYVVDSAGDQVNEAVGEGTDTVQTSISYTLGINVENLTLTGSANLNGTGNAGDNLILGSSGNNQLSGGGGNDNLNGGAGNDTLYGGDGNDLLQGGGGLDYLWGDTGDDTLVAGNSQSGSFLFGEAGDDILDARNLSNTGGYVNLSGGSGNDTYLVDGSGDITISDSNTLGEINTIQFAAGINPADLLFVRPADSFNPSGNIVIEFANGHRLFIGSMGLPYPQDTGEGSGVQVFRFADGTEWNRTEIQQRAGFFFGTSQNDSISSGDGHDYLNGASGDDQLHAGMGNDLLNGSVGNDILFGEDGNDVLGGQHGVDYLDGGDGDDRLFGSYDNDTLIGGAGNDIYGFALGEGADTVDNRSVAAGDLDAISFDTNIVPAQVTASRVGDNLLLTLNANDSISVLDYFLGGSAQVDEIRFANGTIWSPATILGMTNTPPTSTDDSVITPEDTPLVLHASDFGSYSDPDGNPLASVKITALPGAGNLQYHNGSAWVAVALNQVLSRADLDAGKLQFVPAPDGNGDSYASIGFTVGDGLAFALNAKTLSIDVTPVNDAPTGSVVVSGTTVVGQTLTATNTLADADGLGIIGYHWQVSADGNTWTEIAGASDDSVTLTADQLGQQVRAQTRYIDQGGTAESVASGASFWVVSATNLFDGDGNNNILDGTESNDILRGFGGADSLRGYGGADLLEGGDGDDTLDGGDGDDTLNGGNGVDTLYGRAGIDTLNVGDGSWSAYENAYGGDGNDALIATGLGYVSLNGDDGDDLLTASGNRFGSLNGGNGNDTLDTRSMNSDYWVSLSLSGGSGSDTYRVGDGTGSLRINDAKDNSTVADTNMVEFASGIDPASLQLSRSGNDLIVTFANGRTLTVSNQFGTGSNGYEGGVQMFHFADGTTWDRTVIHDHLPILNGTAGNDTLNGDARNEEINGLGGNDILNGNDGDDTLDGGDGDDTLNGGNGVDTLYGRAGIDTLDVGNGSWSAYENAYGGDDNDALIATGLGYVSLNGDDGDDLLTASGNRFGSLNGGNGNDTLDTRSMNSDYWVSLSLSGGSGSDTYRVGDGTGSLRINDAKDNSTVADTNMVEFSSGIDPASLQLSRSGNDLIVTFANGRTLAVSSQFATGSNGYEGGVQMFHFADGTTWDRTVIYDHLPILNGTAGNDTLNGDARNEEINGLGGNDILNGNDGDDTLDGGDGDDTLNGGNGVDTLYGRAGIDTLDVGDGSWSAYENAYGGDGNDALIATGLGYVSLNGDDGDDLLTASGNRFGSLNGGNGNDTLDTRSMNSDYWVSLSLSGGLGSDTYRVGDGTGSLRINDAKDNSTVADTNMVEFASGIDPASLQLSRSGNDLIVTFANGRTLTVSSQFATGSNGYEGGVQTFHFADGTEISRYALPGFGATNGDDTIFGAGGSDSLNGLAGNDSIDAQAGNDTLDGGTGNDILTGGMGNDFFRFSTVPGAGNLDSVSDFTQGQDVLALNSGLFNLQGQIVAESLANVSGAQNEVAGAHLVFNQDDQTLYYDVDGAANGNAVAVVTLTGVTNLTASDVQLYV